MLKTIAFITRKPSTRRDDFREHYENHHVQLALPHLPSLRKYVRNHVLSTPALGEPAESSEPGFDCVTEFWFPDRAALDALLTHLASDAAAEIREDELTFMNTKANVFCAALETLVSGPDRDVEFGDSAKILALAKRPAHQSRSAFIAHYEKKLIPAFFEGPLQPLRCTQNQTVGVEGMEPPFDCVTALWYPEHDSSSFALSRLVPDTEHLLVLRVLECETAIRD